MYPFSGLNKKGISSKGTYPFQSCSSVVPSKGRRVSAPFLIGIFTPGLHAMFPSLSAYVKFCPGAPNVLLASENSSQFFAWAIRNRADVSSKASNSVHLKEIALFSFAPG